MNLRSTIYFAGVAVCLTGIVVVMLRLVPRGDSAMESAVPEPVGKSVASQSSLEFLPLSLPGTEVVTNMSAQRSTNSNDRDNPLFSESFQKTRLAKIWRSRGVTDEDVRNAVEMLRENGFSGASLSDTSLVSQFLPARDITPVYGNEILVPAVVPSGEVVSFSMMAEYPDASYMFERWDISQEGSRIEVRPVGNKRLGPVPAVVVPVELSGELPGLDAGHYTVIFGSMSQSIEKNLTVR